MTCLEMVLEVVRSIWLLGRCSQSLEIPFWVGEGPLGAVVVVGVADLLADEAGTVEEETTEDLDVVALAVGSGPSQRRQ